MNERSFRDTEILKKYGDSVVAEYETAVEYLDVLPSYAMQRFRVFLEAFCVALGAKEGRLEEQIDHLLERGEISFAVKDSFHKARIICNQFQHFSRSSNRGSESLSLERDGSARNLESDKALEVQKHIVEALRVIMKARREGEDVRVEVSKSTGKRLQEDIYCALKFDASYTERIRAAEIFEELALKKGKTAIGLIVDDAFSEEHDWYFRLAAVTYQVAIGFCPTGYAKFKYATYVRGGFIEDKNFNAVEAIAEFAKKGDPEAMACYGDILIYDSFREKEGLQYLECALEKGFNRAAGGLASYYYLGEDEKPRDPVKAFEYATVGASMGEPESMAILGECYCEGVGTQVDFEKGKDLIYKSDEIGCYRARRYRFLKLENIPDRVAAEFEKLAQVLSLIAPKNSPYKSTSSTKRNDLCPCGSGKKFKKCCIDSHKGLVSKENTGEGAASFGLSSFKKAKSYF